MTTLIASGQLDPAIEIWAHSKIVFDFLERFMVNTEEVNEELARDKYGMYLAIDKDAPVAVNILPICDSSVGADESGGSSTNGRNDVTVVNSVDRFRQNQIQVLCPLFRLMAVCERKSSGSLEAIDAVLGCGLVLFPNKFSLTV